MKLCVGAASRRVVEEAAKLRVHQVVASRRQVGEFAPGYTGYTGAELVRVVKDLSGGATQVVRDHGGPHQNGDPDDDWTSALDADADAGFGGLHLDVSELPAGEQPAELARLCLRYDGRVLIEVGGERDSQEHLTRLLDTARRECRPYAAVAAFGGRIWADRQHGHLIGEDAARQVAEAYGTVLVKAHNFDWAGGRQSYAVPGLYNVAPEFGNAEVGAWLRLLPHAEGEDLLNFAYASGAWKRWFRPGEGTRFGRARAALRYHLETPQVAAVLARYDDSPVREAVRDAIICG